MDPMASFNNITRSSETNCSNNIDEFRYRVYPITYSIISVLGFAGNGFVLWVLIRTYREKTAFQIFMFNLAISDLLFVCTLPLRISYYMNKGNWYFGDFLCRISSYTMYVNLYCSILFLTAMSFFRCVAIVFPLRNLSFITEKKAKLVCVAIWVFITLVTSPFLLKGQHPDAANKTKCLEPPATGQLKKLLIMHYIALFIGFVLPFVIIVICCSLIIKTLLKKVMHRSQAARRKAIWMVIIVSVTFLISFTPYHVQRTVHIHYIKNSNCEDTLYMQKSVVITLSLAAFNCCFDPLLYFFSGESFRHRLSTLRSNSILSGSRERPPASAI